MTTETIPDFTITVVGSRLKIEWADAEADYWFVATADGHDAITQIHGNMGRPHTRLIIRWPHDIEGSHGLSYHDARDPQYEPLVEAICAKIAVDKLATKAWDDHRVKQARKNTEWVSQKAAVVLKELAKLDLGLLPPNVTDDKLAALYDSIQDSSL